MPHTSSKNDDEIRFHWSYHHPKPSADFQGNNFLLGQVISSLAGLGAAICVWFCEWRAKDHVGVAYPFRGRIDR